MRINAIITLLIATMLILLLLASTATAQATRVSAITERYLAAAETSRVGPGDSAGTTASERPRPTLQPTPEPEPRREAASQPAAVSRTAARPVSARYTFDELRRNIHRVAPNGYAGPQFAGMQPESAVWGHLIEHGYDSRQIDGLNLDEALILHDLTHGGHASPTRVRSGRPQPARTRAPIQLPAVVKDSFTPELPAAGCANGQCPTTQPARRRGIFGGLFR